MTPKVGQTVQYSNGLGIATVRVTLVEENIKNGRPGFEGVGVGGEVWGYNSQIVRILG